jgi:hypothetical protein
MAHRMDLFAVHDIHIAIAVPNVIPDLATSAFALPILYSFLLLFLDIHKVYFLII